MRLNLPTISSYLVKRVRFEYRTLFLKAQRGFRTHICLLSSPPLSAIPPRLICSLCSLQGISYADAVCPVHPVAVPERYVSAGTLDSSYGILRDGGQALVGRRNVRTSIGRHRPCECFPPPSPVLALDGESYTNVR